MAFPSKYLERICLQLLAPSTSFPLDFWKNMNHFIYTKRDKNTLWRNRTSIKAKHDRDVGLSDQEFQRTMITMLRTWMDKVDSSATSKAVIKLLPKVIQPFYTSLDAVWGSCGSTFLPTISTAQVFDRLVGMKTYLSVVSNCNILVRFTISLYVFESMSISSVKPWFITFTFQKLGCLSYRLVEVLV